MRSLMIRDWILGWPIFGRALWGIWPALGGVSNVPVSQTQKLDLPSRWCLTFPGETARHEESTWIDWENSAAYEGLPPTKSHGVFNITYNNLQHGFKCPLKLPEIGGIPVSLCLDTMGIVQCQIPYGIQGLPRAFTW